MNNKEALINVLEDFKGFWKMLKFGIALAMILSIIFTPVFYLMESIEYNIFFKLFLIMIWFVAFLFIASFIDYRFPNIFRKVRRWINK